MEQRDSKWCSDLPASNISVHIHCSPGPHTESISKGHSVKLQGRYVDVVYAHQHIEGVKDILKST